MGLDRLVFIPASRSPFKPRNAPANDQVRLRMLRRALAGLSWCEVSEIELKRGGVSYTVDTVRQLGEVYRDAKLFLLIGEDHLAGLHKWRDVETLLRLVEFVVVPRPGTKVTPEVSGGTFHRLNGWPVRISSSQIRERVRGGQPIEPWVPGPVAEVIRDNRLYLE
jgi:nicotinate-nucleotide adenylyltransferase